MINGLFLDPRAWKIDFLESGHWNTENYGIHIDLHNDAFKIPDLGIDDKYKFCLATEVWEKPMQRTLQYLRDKGIKIFLIAREPIKHGDLVDAMFSYEKFNLDGSFYFKPDVVFAAGQKYADLWSDKTKTVVTGYPRFEWYLNKKNHKTKSEIFKNYGIEKDRKIIFFISYPPYHYKKINGKDKLIGLFEEHNGAMEVLEKFALNNGQKYQIISKIHPASMKCFLKGKNKKNEVAGLLKKYYENPTKYFKVIGDVRSSGDVSKDLLMRSDFIVGFNSTMLLEGMILNKPIINVILGKCKDFSTPYNNLSATVFDKQSFMDSCEDFDSGFYDKEPILKEDLELVENYLFKIDGKCCERVCNAIKEEIK